MKKFVLPILFAALSACSNDIVTITVSMGTGADSLRPATERAVQFWKDRGYDIEFIEKGGDVEVRWGECSRLDLFAVACLTYGEVFLVPGIDWWDAVESPECPTEWSLDTNSTIKHELGHALGLWHVDDRSDVMHWATEACFPRNYTIF